MAYSGLQAIPSADYDLFGDDMLNDPYDGYRAMRSMGSAVHLPRSDIHFIGRFQDVRAALTDWRSFSSASGTGFNPVINQAWDEALISQDPPTHTQRRKIMTAALSPAALKPAADTIDARAGELADRIVAMESFDGVTDVAHDLPVHIVMDLIGWPQEVRPHLLGYAEGSVESVSPPGPRMESGLRQLQEMMALIADTYDNNRVLPGGLADQLIAASHRGEIEREAAIGMLVGYIVAAFDTTISAMSSGLWLFAQNPAEWDKLRADPDLANSAATEIIRMETPLHNFGRMTRQDVTLSDGTVLPEGIRVALSLGSANRDERQFELPDSFRIDRKEKQNLGFGFGPHLCAGQGLARMELNAVFRALAAKVKRFEFADEPSRAIRITRSFRSLPLRAIAA